MQLMPPEIRFPIQRRAPLHRILLPSLRPQTPERKMVSELSHLTSASFDHSTLTTIKERPPLLHNATSRPSSALRATLLP